jgi:hypothetical protein
MTVWQKLLLMSTPRGRQTRRLALDFSLSLDEAFNLVRSQGSVSLARQELDRRKEAQKRLSASLWQSPSRYELSRPENTYTSGSRLSS